ncbi:hypothetical protein [Nocardioides daphniae]|uniref:hypothetical protein n=1 Tax=Nocardioides daphniae TaxID=402297 RepID=UPI001EE8DF8A|nr:hypothetical protein [Nocardioides daphniae]
MSARATSLGPSTTKLSRSSGTGTTIADQTTIDSPELGPTRRATTLPQAHDVAAAKVSSSPSSGVAALRPHATTARPITPRTTPTTWREVGISCSRTLAKTPSAPPAPGTKRPGRAASPAIAV